jgi:uncharacterized protein (TIGR00369 family)
MPREDDPTRPNSGEAAHFRALESLYAQAPVNGLFSSQMDIVRAGACNINFTVGEQLYHAAGAVHGSAYFKMLDDAAFYAANSLVTDRFLLTTAFNVFFTKPLKQGPVMACGRWVSGRKRVYIAESHLIDSSGEEVARGTGTFMRSAILLSSLPGYAERL